MYILETEATLKELQYINHTEPQIIAKKLVNKCKHYGARSPRSTVEINI